MATKNEIRVGVKFDVDNKQLELSKQKIHELTADLQKIQTQYNQAKILGTADKDLANAAKEAKKLEQILNSSWNSKLGQLDLSKFNNSIKQSYKDMTGLKKALESAGPTGTAAFNNIASSVLNTNVELRKTSVILDKMALTMANTVRFGISSSIFNTLTGQISKAYNYSLDLDKSLNNIRIVSSQSADQMERYAKYANQAAKELGASTLDYTDASLIYYQQGLSEDEVLKRTDVTIKAANALGTSAEEVSQYLTAIWNNFDDGSKSLEYYADVITALGASTASSAEEIAEGLEKFAAIGDTVGLSYEYATTALATVTAETRQSADTVGTAFKTLFSRIQDLELGETLEDGTTLGKYSQALEKVGINIMDQNGNLKEMDTILDEMGEKWNTLNAAQKTALAQNVAGTRQYTQLVALMDNWDKFSENLKTANNATGTLQKQQDIYMESTQAHLQKVRTEAEKTYDILFDTKTVNSFADSLSGLLGIFNNLISGVGGGAQAFTYLGSIVTNVFSRQIGGAINRQIQNFEAMRRNVSSEDLKKELIDMYTLQGETGIDPDSARVRKEAEVYSQIREIKEQITQDEYNRLIAMQKSMGIDEERITYLKEYKDIGLDILNNENASIADYKEMLEYAKESVEQEEKKLSFLTREKNLYQTGIREDEETEDFRQALSDLGQRRTTSMEQFKVIEEARMKIIDQRTLSEKEIQTILEAQNQALLDAKDYEGLIVQGLEGRQAAEDGTLENLEQEQIRRQSILDQMKEQAERQKAISATVQALSVTVTTLTTISGIIKTINDDTLDEGQKVERIVTTLLTTVPMLVPQFISLAKDLPKIAIGFKLITASEYEAAKAAGTAGAAMWSAFWPVLAVLAAVTAAIAGVSLVVKTLSDDYHSAEQHAKDMSDAAKRVKEEHEALITTIKTLDQQLNTYDTAVDKLKNCTKGTEEWKDSLREVNSSIRDVIDSLGSLSDVDLKSVLTTDEQGNLVLNSDEINKIKGKANLQAAAAGYASARVDRDAQWAQNYSQLLDAARQINPEQYWQAIGSGLGNGIGFGGPIGAGVGLAISTHDWDEFNDNIRMTLNNNLEDLTKSMSIEEFRTNLKNLGIDTEHLKDDTLKDLQKEIIDLSDKTKQAADNLDLLTKQSVMEMLGGETDSATVNLVKNRLETNTSREEQSLLYGTIYNMAGDETWWSTAKPEYNDLLRRLQAAGMKNLTAGEDIVQGDRENRKLEFRDSDTNSLITMTAQEVAEKIAAYEQSQSVEEFGKQTNTLWSKLSDTIGEDLTNALKSYYATGNLEKLTTAQISELEKQGVTSNYGISKAAGMEWSDVSDILGYDFDFSKAKENLQERLNSLTNDYSDTIKDAFNTIDTSELSIESKKIILDLLQDRAQDTELGEIIPEGITNFLKTLGEEGKLQNYIDEITGIQQTKEQQIDTALAGRDKELEGYGLKSDEVAEYAKHLMDVAGAAENAQDGIDDVNDSLEENATAAVLVAKSVMRMNQGIEKLANNQEDWLDILSKSSIESEEYSDALTEIRDAIGDLFDLSENTEKYLNGEFFAKNAELIEQAANGSAEAIDKLREATTDEIVTKIVLENGFNENDIVDFQTYLDDIQTSIPDIIVGTELDLNGMDEGEKAFLEKCQNIIDAAGMTASQAKAFFESMGFEAEFEVEQQPIEKKGRGIRTVQELKGAMEVTMPDGTTRTVPAGWETKTYPGEEYSYVDYVDTFALSTKEGDSPNIKKITKKGSGSMNNYSSRNSGGGSPGKSSGGGGGSKTKDPNKMDPLKEQADRYHEVNTQITKVDNALKKLTSQEEKFVGAKLIDNLNKQWALLNTQVDNYNEKLRIAQNEQQELRDKLSLEGTKFNADNTISNYMEVFAAKQNYVNSLIDNYNNMSAEEQETYKDTVEQAKEDFKEFQKDLDRYDTLVSNEIPGLTQSIQDALDKQIELNIKKFNMEVSITLDMAQAERDWNAWKAKVLDGIKESDILGNAQARLQDFSSYYDSAAAGSIQVQTRHLEDTLDELYKMDKGLDNIYGDNRTQALEDLQTYYKQLMEDLEGVLDLQTEIHKAYLDMMDEAQDKFKEQLETYSMIGDLLNNNMKIVQLIYGEETYGQLSNYYQQQYDNNMAQLDFLRQQKQLWADQMELFEEGSDEWQSAKEKWMDAAKELSSTLADALDTARQSFENAIKEIFQDLNNLVTNNLGLDYIDEEWELINKNADRYLDTINAVAGVRSLESKYIDAINDTTNTKNQQRLNALMESELNILKSADKLSQADLDRAELKYQIALAQIALEDAQQQKTQMRLRRDSQGNYTYQYTADEDAINKAKEELSNLYIDLYNFDKDQYKNNLDEIYNTWNEYQQKMAEAALINDPELRAQKELLIQQEYNELLNGMLEQNTLFRMNLQESSYMSLNQMYQDDIMNFSAYTQAEKDNLLNEVGGAFNQLLEIYGIDAEAFKNMTLEEQNAIIENLGTAFGTLSGFYNEDVEKFNKLADDNKDILAKKMVPQWNSSIQIMADKISGNGGLQKTTENSMNKIKNVTAEYDKQVEQLAKTAEKSTTEIGKGLDKDITKTQQLVKDNNQLITGYDNELKAVKKVCDQIDELIKKYGTAETAAKKATEAAYKYWLQEQQQQAAAAKKQTQTTSNANSSNVNSNTSAAQAAATASAASTSPQGNGSVDIGDKVTLNGKIASSSYSSPGLTPISRYRGAQLYVQMINEGRPSPYHLGTSPNYSSSTAVGWTDEDQISGYDTGGYTGTWSNSGKLAFLHQKELVLNADDTTNMLNAVSIMRNLANNLGENILARLAGVTAGSGSSIGGDSLLEQNVHIDATFPGVKDAKEIEDALNNLVNSASQRAFEKR